MNREIRFRAWLKESERMIEPYFFELYHYSDENRINQKEYRCYEDWRDLEDGRHQECEIMQFTGLKDKNDKEIYEGDIIKIFEIDDFDDESAIKEFIVEWGDDYPAFTLKGYPDLEYNSLQHACIVVSCEVIGNIYQNSELTKTP